MVWLTGSTFLDSSQLSQLLASIDHAVVMVWLTGYIFLASSQLS